MFSKTERNYILGRYTPSPTHKRVLNYRIKNKIKEFYVLEIPILQNLAEFSNIITEFSNISKHSLSKLGSLERDSIPRPNAYEAFALPG
jgi:hypothetical protein